MAVVVPPSVPPPEAIVATTFIPATFTGFKPASVICTPGCGASTAPFVAVAGGCVAMTSRAAAPVRMAIGDVVSVVMPVPVNVNTSVPMLPVYGGTVNEANPAALEVATSWKLVFAGCTFPVAVITTPACATGLFAPSRSWTCTGAGKETPTVIVAGAGCTSAILVATALTPVAEKVVLNAPDVAVSVLTPAVAPNVHEPTVAMPAAFVVAFTPVALPPPLATANTTAAPATGLLLAFNTSTLGAIATFVPTVALCALPAFLLRVAAGPATIVIDVAATRAPVAAVTVTRPSVAPSVTVVDAWPFAAVVDTAGANVAPPLEAPKVTETFGTELPSASVTRATSATGSVTFAGPVCEPPATIAMAAAARFVARIENSAVPAGPAIAAAVARAVSLPTILPSV